jgi:hypothetical protein
VLIIAGFGPSQFSLAVFNGSKICIAIYGQKECDAAKKKGRNVVHNITALGYLLLETQTNRFTLA